MCVGLIQASGRIGRSIVQARVHAYSISSYYKYVTKLNYLNKIII